MSRSILFCVCFLSTSRQNIDRPRADLYCKIACFRGPRLRAALRSPKPGGPLSRDCRGTVVCPIFGTAGRSSNGDRGTRVLPCFSTCVCTGCLPFFVCLLSGCLFVCLLFVCLLFVCLLVGWLVGWCLVGGLVWLARGRVLLVLLFDSFLFLFCIGGWLSFGCGFVVSSLFFVFFVSQILCIFAALSFLCFCCWIVLRCLSLRFLRLFVLLRLSFPQVR